MWLVCIGPKALSVAIRSLAYAPPHLAAIGEISHLSDQCQVFSLSQYINAPPHHYGI